MRSCNSERPPTKRARGTEDEAMRGELPCALGAHCCRAAGDDAMSTPPLCGLRQGSYDATTADMRQPNL